MKNINYEGLPAGYKVITNEENPDLYGLAYAGKAKEVVIIEPEYTMITAFKAYGRAFLAYFEGEDTGWVIRNRKGDVQTDFPIVDFVACGKAIYARVPSERGIVLASIDNELLIGKTFGVFTFDDYYTKEGYKVLPNNRKTLDVRDKNGLACQINMIDNTLDDVTSFGSGNKLSAEEKPEEYIRSWNYIVNVTRGTVKREDSSGQRSVVVAELSTEWLADKANLDLFGILFNTKPEFKHERVPVKRHFEEEDKYIYRDIASEKSEVIDSVLKTIPSFAAPEDLDTLAHNFFSASENAVKMLDDMLHKGFTRVNDKYSVKVITEDGDGLFLLVSDGRKVKIISDGVDDNIRDGQTFKLNIKNIVEKDLDREAGAAIPKPDKYVNKRNSYYKKLYSVEMECEALNSIGNYETLKLDFMLFDEFTYGPMVQERKERYNYSSDNIVLTTTTNDVYIAW